MAADPLREILDSLTDPIVVLRCVRDDAGAIVDFTFEEANPAACAFNGATPDELLGSSMLARHPVAATRELIAAYAGVVATGEPLVRDDWAGPSDLPGAQRRFDMRAVRLGDGVSATWRDVTDRHEAEAALADSEARFRQLAESSTDVVLEVDDSGLVTWVTPNVEEVLGWRATDLVGRPGEDLVHEEDLALLRANDLRMPGGTLRMRTASGGLLPMSARITLRDGPDGRPSGAVVGLADVSALVEARDRERAAREAEAQTRLSMDEAAIGLVIAQLDGTVTYANPAMHRMLKAPEGALAGVSIGRGSGPADELAGRAAVTRVIDGTSSTEHLRRSLPDFAGGRVWVDIYLSPIRGADAEVAAILVQVVDVSAEVATRESLARSLDHFRVLAENATDVVYETDPHGVIQWISPSVREALGWDPAVLVGTLAMDLVHPDDAPMVMRERVEVYQGEEKRNIEVRFLGRDGQVRTMSVRAHPIRDESGVVTGAVLGLRDVTEENLASRALEDSERLFRTALEEAPTGMAIADPDDHLVRANPALARMLGRVPEDLVGHRLRDFLRHGAESDPTCAELLVATGETRIENHEHEVLDPVAGTEWIAHSVAAVRDRSGEPLFFVHQVADITGTKHREADLGYRASHDLLTGVLNREGLMSRLSEWLPDESAASQLALLYCDVDRLKEINDAHGHAAGDAALVEAAHRMHAAVRRGDIVARISGDEFVIVLDRIRDVLDALAVAEKVRSVVHGPVATGDGDVALSVSVGVAVSEPGDLPDDVIARADAALYRAKVAGRDRVAT